ncbi:MAG: insulinase family protein, partial [Burkholderiales bacterium]|nr:insulinase family protein [Burkholderiales bacterium]
MLKRLPLLALLAASFAAAAATLARPADVPKIPYQKHALKNGLEVILVEDRSLPLVAVNLWYHVGAANEAPGRTGFAHLFEHMMFAATKHLPRGMADNLLEAAGVSDSNGSTSFDRTNYYDTLPAHQLELALWIHSDRMGYLIEVLDQTALANQQDVVRNERRQRRENQPYGIVEEALWHNLFPVSHPYHAVIMGSHADIQAATLTDIKDFFKLYYRPNNATLTIVGDIDKGKTLALVEKYFGRFRAGDEVKPLAVPTPIVTAEKQVVIEDRVELQRVIMGWHTAKIYTPGDAELSLAGQILGGGKASRLYRSLVYEKQIAQDVSAAQDSLQLGSVFTVDVTARPGRSAREIEAAIDEELEKLRASPVEGEELERARNMIETSMIAGLQKVGGRADLLNHYNHYTGDPGYFARELAAYRRVTPADIQRVVNEQLKKAARVVIHGVPGTPNFGPE